MSASRFIARLISQDTLAQVTPEDLLAQLAVHDTQEQLNFGGADHLGYLTACRRATRQLGLKPGEQAVLVNGRVRPFLCVDQVNGLIDTHAWCVARWPNSTRALRRGRLRRTRSVRVP